jgi:hypothetical protein
LIFSRPVIKNIMRRLRSFFSTRSEINKLYNAATCNDSTWVNLATPQFGKISGWASRIPLGSRITELTSDDESLPKRYYFLDTGDQIKRLSLALVKMPDNERRVRQEFGLPIGIYVRRTIDITNSCWDQFGGINLRGDDEIIVYHIDYVEGFLEKF